jgi:RNA polymerase sigma-70 factor (ECF subfamily)
MCPTWRTEEGNSQPGENPSLDSDLINSVAHGDEAALGELYDRYAGLVYSVALRVLRDTAAAEEILQDIFFQLWQKASQFDASRGAMASWLVVMARNRSISRLRRKSSIEETNVEDIVVAKPYRIENSLMQSEMLAKVRGAMDGLPAAQRNAVELAYFEGLTHSEIAERTGEPLGTIKTRLRSAVETLRMKFA